MGFLQHAWEFLLFLIILVGPLPLCLWLVLLAPPQLHRAGFSRSLLILLTGWCGLEITLALWLGMVKSLNLPAILIAELLIFMVGLGLLLPDRSALLPELKQRFTFSAPLNQMEGLILGSLAFAGVVAFERSLTQPIINFDSLAYHLPAMARWHQVGFFEVLEQFQYNVGWYPYSWEALCTLFLFPFQEDYVVTLPNLVAWAILGLAVSLVSRDFGAARVYSLAAACLVLTMPLLMQHLNTIHIDLQFTAFFMAALYFMLAYWRSQLVVDLVLLFVSLGIFLGIKTSAIPYALLLIAAFVGLELKAIIDRLRSPELAPRPYLVDRFALILSCLGISLFLFLGSFWYVKNWIATGNPLGFVKIQIGDTVIFPGTLTPSEINRNSLAELFNPLRLTHWIILTGRVVFWLQIPFLLLFLQTLRLPFARVEQRQQIKRSSVLCALALLVVTGWLYWNTPYSAASSGVPEELLTWQNPLSQLELSSFFGKALRFAFPFLAVLGVVAALSATMLGVRTSVVGLLVFASTLFCTIETTILEALFTNSFKTDGGTVKAIVGSLKSNPFQGIGAFLSLLSANTNLLFNLICVFGVIGLGWVILRSKPSQVAIANLVDRFPPPTSLNQQVRTLMLVGCMGLILTASFVAREKRDANRQEVYSGIYDFLATNVAPTETIGYSDSYRSYLLYGKDFSRQVTYVPTKEAETLPQWLETLKQRQVSVVAIGPVPSRKSWEESPRSSWFERSDSPFTPVFGQYPWVETILYRIKS